VARDAKGKFLPGFDPRRHRFTKEEQRRGYQTAMTQQPDWDLLGWVYRKVRGHYRAVAGKKAAGKAS
jgi:hypothetical protein